MKRRGTTLVELMVVMSACVVVLTLSAELIHRILSVQSRTAAAIAAERSAQRLSATFRRDVQDAARRLDVADPATLLQLAVGADEVVYRQEGPILERQVVRKQATPAREQFVLPEELQVRIDERAPGLLTLSLESRSVEFEPGKIDQASPLFITPMHLEATAVLGKNARLVAESVAEDSP
jgi:hypothetical protein